MLQHTCFISEAQRYPDEFRIKHVLAGAPRFFANWDADFAAELVDEFRLTPKQRIKKLSRGQRSAIGVIVGVMLSGIFFASKVAQIFSVTSTLSGDGRERTYRVIGQVFFASAGTFSEAIDVLEADDADLLERFGRWYIAERDPRYLRRNALVALGNTADGSDPAVVRLLEAFLADPDPVLRSHATWAAAELGRRDLLGGLDDDEDPLVAEEMALIRGRVET